MNANRFATSLRSLVLLFIIATVSALIGDSAAIAVDPTNQTTVFRVKGMTCALCGKAIQKTLGAIEGVKDVKVDRAAERVTVLSAPEVSRETLEGAIESAGSYRAELIEPEETFP